MSGADVGSRESFAAALCDIAGTDERIALVSADSLKALRAGAFRERYPERLFEVGIAEQTAVAFGAGLAAAGMVPFVGTYAGFLTMRAAEQMRTFVAYPNLTVKFVGLNGGLYGGEREGVTHQFYEDVGILRTVPRFEIVVPCDGPQTRRATQAIAERPGPGYIRVGSGREPMVLGADVPFEVGRARVLHDEGRDIALFACGPVLRLALAAARLLSERGIGATVVEVHTLKPLDTDTIADVLASCSAALTVEDHNIIGGLGSAVAEVAAGTTSGPVHRMGIEDHFAVSGEREALWRRYGFTVDGVVERAVAVLDGVPGTIRSV